MKNTLSLKEFLCVFGGGRFQDRVSLCSPYYAGTSTCVASQVLILKACAIAAWHMFLRQNLIM